MTINKAKASAYNTVTTAAVYDYMRQYLAKISRMIEPEEDGTGNAYKAAARTYKRKKNGMRVYPVVKVMTWEEWEAMKKN